MAPPPPLLSIDEPQNSAATTSSTSSDTSSANGSLSPASAPLCVTPLAISAPLLLSAPPSSTTAPSTGNATTANSVTTALPLASIVSASASAAVSSTFGGLASTPATASSSSAIATAIPLPQQQQHLIQQIHQQQRLLSLHLSSASSPPGTSNPNSKFPLMLNSSEAAVAPSPSPAATAIPPATVSQALATVAAVTPPPPADRHSRDDCWSEGATLTLISAWGDRYLELNRGNLKQKHWRDVADSVNRRSNGTKPQKTDVQCKNRLDTLKKKYKLEKTKIVTGGGPSKWTFFERLDELIGLSKKPKKPLPPVSSSNPAQRSSPPLGCAIYPTASITSTSTEAAAITATATPTTGPLQIPLLSTIIGSKRPLEEIDQKFSIPLIPPTVLHHVLPNNQHHHTSNTVITANQTPSTAPNPNLNHNLNLHHPQLHHHHHHHHIPSVIPNHLPNNHFGTPNHFSAVENNHCINNAAAACEDEDMSDSSSPNNGKTPAVALPHKTLKRKRLRNNPMKLLARAIVKFGEVYEKIEIAKQQQMVELEKQRMEFTKEIELQRLKLFMQTQVELAKLKYSTKNCNTEHYL